MKPVRHARGEATRQAILEAAETVFAEVGFATARLEDVAAAVGIRRPSIIYYFANKQELYDAVEEDIFACMHQQALKGIAANDKPIDRLLGLLDGWLDFLVARPSAARIIQRLVADVTPRRGNPTQFSNILLRDVEMVVNEGIAAGDFRPIPPMHVVNAVGSSSLFYVCNGKQLGSNRSYDAADPKELESFRELLHLLTRAAVAPATAR
ncbi:TetR/AcrR family transcriptional regulator [Sphingomonas cavernae]|uniref:TetR/AcrR family transcriptional regulator n=1 Tax=Sphingomonas cavernae TaxID=2320861 RepID=A0A418WPF7_9SPHN|nr:helix-turn-helix domain-containing protein [Sphingomonas cavernae]RJF93103.1 TetR/AcrR family transcriptional regulator [Sphingomonas cavernae]